MRPSPSLRRADRPADIRGVVSDLDGTLLRSDGTLSPATRGLLPALRRLGVPLVVATARTPRAIGKIAGHEDLGRVVCANGAVVWDAATDEVVHQRSFDPTALAIAVRRLRRDLPEAGVALLSARTMFLDPRYLALRNKRSDGAETFSDLEQVLTEHRVVLVAVRHPRLTAHRLLATTAAAFDRLGVASFAGPATVDVAPGAATKAVAVADELARWGCPRNSTVVFGDMPNDLPLFAQSGWACAMANSHPEVLAAADEVVGSNDDDGVARTVRQILAAVDTARGSDV